LKHCSSATNIESVVVVCCRLRIIFHQACTNPEAWRSNWSTQICRGPQKSISSQIKNCV